MYICCVCVGVFACTSAGDTGGQKRFPIPGASITGSCESHGIADKMET